MTPHVLPAVEPALGVTASTDSIESGGAVSTAAVTLGRVGEESHPVLRLATISMVMSTPFHENRPNIGTP
jgi:hypothetical protein